MRAQGAKVIAIANHGDTQAKGLAGDCIYVCLLYTSRCV